MQHLERVVDLHARVEGAVVELVVVVGGEQLVHAVGGELVHEAVVGELLVALVHQRESHERQRERERADRIARPARQVVGSRARKQPTRGKEQGDRRDEHPAEQRGERIGLADVARHFARVDQVVDRDEVEARRELIPEQKLGHAAEDEREGRREEPRRQQRSMPPARPHSRRREREPRTQRRRQVEQREQVEDRADAEHLRKVPQGQRHLGVRHRKQRDALEHRDREEERRKHHERSERAGKGAGEDGMEAVRHAEKQTLTIGLSS